MKILTNAAIKHLFIAITLIMASALVISELALWLTYGMFAPILILIFALMTGMIYFLCFCYFQKQNKIIEVAASQIKLFLAGDTNARVACNDEGELYKLFHAVNTLATVLNAHAENEIRAKEFLKTTISDISHQLKTPLAALNIYNGLVQGESDELSTIREFADLSEQELDRIESLVQSLLKITKLDAGSIVMEKTSKNVADMMSDIEHYFSYRAKHEKKELILSGMDNIQLICDRHWMTEAISNLVKNAFDHTKAGSRIQVQWKQLTSVIQITIVDDGNGIHPEDIHYIFKRFYRSRYSQDTQGIGLGLPLTKAIIEAHEGTITVESILGQGSTFTISFLIPTKM